MTSVIRTADIFRPFCRITTEHAMRGSYIYDTARMLQSEYAFMHIENRKVKNIKSAASSAAGQILQCGVVRSVNRPL